MKIRNFVLVCLFSLVPCLFAEQGALLSVLEGGELLVVTPTAKAGGHLSQGQSALNGSSEKRKNADWKNQVAIWYNMSP